MFPSNTIATFFRFEDAQFFQIKPKNEECPKVDFINSIPTNEEIVE